MSEYIYQKPLDRMPKIVSISRIKDGLPYTRQCLTKVSELVDEILVVDNGSDDENFAVYDEFPKVRRFTEDEFEKYPLFAENATIKDGIVCTEGLDEPRDRQILQCLINVSEAEAVYFVDSDEWPEPKVTREVIEEFLTQREHVSWGLRHLHFWGEDGQHYRVDARWKPRHNRMIWKVTPECHIIPHRRTNPNIVYNLKGKHLNTDYCVLHWGHVDKERNQARYELWKSIDNESHSDATGMTYAHMIDEEYCELAEWNPNSETHDFGNESVLIICLHGGGDNIMLTPTIHALKQVKPDLDISIMGIGKIDERDFKTHEIWETNPHIKRYYDSSIDHHPFWWNEKLFQENDMQSINTDIQELSQLTSFDQIIMITLQENTQLHRIDRMAAQFNLQLPSQEMHLYPSRADNRWAASFMMEVLKHGSKVASVHRFCGHPPKSWSFKETESLCKALTEDDWTVILWNQDEREREGNFLESEPYRMDMPNLIHMRDHSDELTVNRTAALMSLCDIHIGADSMPMHIASAARIPVVGIFEKTRPHETAPMNRNSIIMVTPDVHRGIQLPFLEQNHKRIVPCGTSITAKDVLSVLEVFSLDMGVFDLSKLPEKVYPLNCAYDQQELLQVRDFVEPMNSVISEFPQLIHNPLKWFDYCRFLELIENLGSLHILDLGCGSSVFPMYLASLGHRVHAVDPDEEAIKVLADAVNQAGGHSHVRTTVGSVFDLPEKHYGVYDAVCLISVLEHIENDKDTLLEAVKFLKPGGILVVTTDFYSKYIEYPDANRTIVSDKAEGHCDSRIYDKKSLYERIINPLKEVGLTLLGDTDFDNVNINDPRVRPVRGLYSFARMFFRKKS